MLQIKEYVQIKMKHKFVIYVSLSYLLALLCSGYVSFVAFSFCKSTFEQLKDSERLSSDDVMARSEAESGDDIDLSTIYEFKTHAECVNQHFYDAFDCNALEATRFVVNKNVTIIEKINENFLIKFIECMLVVGLFLQVFLAIYTVFLVKFSEFDKYIFHISDWAINTPPILGVLANLVSFSLLLSQVDNIQAMFSVYFFQAVITTLIGGVFYIINLALKIVIHPRLESVV